MTGQIDLNGNTNTNFNFDFNNTVNIPNLMTDININNAPLPPENINSLINGQLSIPSLTN